MPNNLNTCDDLNAFKGIALGIILGEVLWAAVIAGLWLAGWL